MIIFKKYQYSVSIVYLLHLLDLTVNATTIHIVFLANIESLLTALPVVHLERSVAKPKMHALLLARKVWLSVGPGVKWKWHTIGNRHEITCYGKIISRNPQPFVAIISVSHKMR